MRWASLRDAAVDLGRANRAYFFDAGMRAKLRRALRQSRDSTSDLEAREFEVAGPIARAYAGLTDSSLAITGMRPTAGERSHLNLVLASLPANAAFAGIHTALIAARSLASKLGLRLRVLTLDPGAADSPARVEHYLEQSFALPGTRVLPRESLVAAKFGQNDIWLATHWKTAHALQVACEAGVVDRRLVAYLIQDYEPGFHAWSTESVLAESSYRAGFIPVVNSLPLWRHLGDAAGVVFEEELVFAPEFEDERLQETARARRAKDTVTVLYYGRPSKARNLYRLGLSALRATAIALPRDVPVRFISAGEPHADVDLGNGRMLVSLGRLSWEDYFVTLADAEVMLSLQQTPHPSHPPFDAAISGAWAVTNDFAGGRQGVHPRIVAVQPSPAVLAEALVSAITRAAGANPEGYLPLEAGALGRPLDEVLDAVATRLSVARD